MSIVLTVLSLVPFYLLGSFPTGFLVARAYGVDITTRGSGNVGTTNVLRTLGRKAGIITLLGDLSKGFGGVLLAHLIVDATWYPPLAGVVVVAGHCFSIPPVLKGGKGVATSLGVLLGIWPFGALLALAAFALSFLATRIVSVSSMCAAFIASVSAMLTNKTDQVTLSLSIICLIIVFRHSDNIKRLIEGKEGRFEFKKKP